MNDDILSKLNTVIEDIRDIQSGAVEPDKHNCEAMVELLNEVYNYLVLIGE
jgi:uncharacterized protein YjaG (DUF416 family)